MSEQEDRVHALQERCQRLEQRLRELETQQQQQQQQHEAANAASGAVAAASSWQQNLPTELDDPQAFLDSITVQPPKAPLCLPVVTQARVEEVCESQHVALLLYRIAEAHEGMNLAQVMAAADAEALWHPEHVALGLQYASTLLLKAMEVPSAAALRPRITQMWSTNPSFRNDWQGTLRNLFAGRPNATMQRGVIYQGSDGKKVTHNNYMTSFAVAEFEPATGKTYLALARRSELLSPASPRVQATAQQNLMALKYSPNMIIMASRSDGRIHWQNSSSCAAIGTVASDVALPIRGVCGEFELDYVSQLFWGNDRLRKEMEQTCGSGLVFKRRVQIKGPALRQLLGITAPRREVWHHLQVCQMKDPASHEQMYMISQSDVTEVVLAERRVKQLQKQQLSLLKEMLPQQVIDVLLSQKNGSYSSRPKRRTSVATDPFAQTSSVTTSSPRHTGTGGFAGGTSSGDDLLAWPTKTASHGSQGSAAGLHGDRPAASKGWSFRSNSGSYPSTPLAGSLRGSFAADMPLGPASNLPFLSSFNSPRERAERDRERERDQAKDREREAQTAVGPGSDATPPRNRPRFGPSPPNSMSRHEAAGMDATQAGQTSPPPAPWSDSPFLYNVPAHLLSTSVPASGSPPVPSRHGLGGTGRGSQQGGEGVQPTQVQHEAQPLVSTNLAGSEPTMACGVSGVSRLTEATAPGYSIESGTSGTAEWMGQRPPVRLTLGAKASMAPSDATSTGGGAAECMGQRPPLDADNSAVSDGIGSQQDQRSAAHTTFAAEAAVRGAGAASASKGPEALAGPTEGGNSVQQQQDMSDKVTLESVEDSGAGTCSRGGGRHSDPAGPSGEEADGLSDGGGLGSDSRSLGRGLRSAKSFRFPRALDAAQIDTAITSNYCNWSESDRLARELRQNVAGLHELRSQQLSENRPEAHACEHDGAQGQGQEQAPAPGQGGRRGGPQGQEQGQLHPQGYSTGHGQGSGQGQGQGQAAGDALLELSGVGSQQEADAWQWQDRSANGGGVNGYSSHTFLDRNTGASFDRLTGLSDRPTGTSEKLSQSQLPASGQGSGALPFLRMGSGALRISQADQESMQDLQLSRRDVMALSTWHEEVTILFTDIKGFTSLSSSLHPGQVMLFLNHLYSLFDELVTHYDIFKVETIGDSYMVAGGLFDRSGCLTLDAEGNVVPTPEAASFGENRRGTSEPGGPAVNADAKGLAGSSIDSVLLGADGERTSPGAGLLGGLESKPERNILGGYDPDHAAKVLAFAKDMSAAAASVVDPLGNPVQMRVGIHTGSVMSGVVGRKCPRFCLFGDTVNTASRMESTGEPGRIHVSQAFRDLLPDEPWQTHEVFAKGKGALTTYFLDWEVPVVESEGQGPPASA